MTRLEEYRALDSQYNQAVTELKEIQAQEERKKKEVAEIVKKVKIFLDNNS